MILDFLIVPPIIVTTLLGLRDGIVRKLVAIVASIAGLFLGQVYMHQAATFFVENLETEQSSAPVYGFITIYLLVISIVSLGYHLVAKNYKIGGVLDRIAGSALGLFQGVLFMSCLLWIFSLQGVPSKKTAKQSELYKPVVNVAPQILDLFTSVGSETEEFLKERATPSEDPLKRESLQRMPKRDTSSQRDPAFDKARSLRKND